MATLNRVEMAEIRLDLTEYTPDQIKKVFAHPTPTVATCRPDNMGPEKQLEILTLAIESGAHYVDVEIEAAPVQQQALLAVARKHNCRVIISYHNYECTPGMRELYSLLDECYAKGADVAKLAVQANSKADSARILGLYSNEKPLVALGMGEAGKITRVLSPSLGAEFTFAAMDNGAGTAPGQISYSRMKALLETIENELNA